MKVKDIIKLPILYFLLVLSGFIKRNPNIWLFGNFSGSFSDNSKYLYLYTIKNTANINAIWISKNRDTAKQLNKQGLKAYYKRSLMGYFYSLQAGVFIYNGYVSDINEWTYRGALKISLWHGIPLKKIEFDIQNGTISNAFNNSLKSRFLYRSNYIKPDKLITISPLAENLFRSAFKLNESQCWNIGYPRNDILKLSKSTVLKLLKKHNHSKIIDLIYKSKNYDKVYIYTPTWRDSGRDFIEEARIDLTKLDDFLYKKNILFITKFHTNTSLKISSSYKNIIALDAHDDVYPLLPFTDCLITDYSSILFDYLHLNRKIILFSFDIHKYLSERELYFDYHTIFESFSIVNDFNGLIRVMEEGCFKEPLKENDKLLQLITPSIPGCACKNITAKILEAQRKHK